MTTQGNRDLFSGPYFDGAAAGDLMIRRCMDCAHWVPAVAMRCTACGGPELEWAASRGSGVLISWTVAHQRPRPGEPPAPNVVLGLVELDEGPWVHAQLIDVDPDTVQVGDRLAATFVRFDSGEFYPAFVADQAQTDRSGNPR